VYPIFSILTASLNSEKTIFKTLKSIQSQTFQDFEHIVIDGNSFDTTSDILTSFEDTYNLQWISEPDKGIADALNKGLTHTKGRFILILQADDHLFSRDTLKKAYAFLANDKYDIYSFPIIFNDPIRGFTLKKPIHFLWWNHFKFIFFHQGCFVKNSVFENIGSFRTQYKINMDYDFFYRALANNHNVKFGSFPISVMGGSGIGSNSKFIPERLMEERMVQLKNEHNPIWRYLQVLFSALYLPYKKLLLKITKTELK